MHTYHSLWQELLWDAEEGELKCMNFKIKEAWACIPDSRTRCVILISHVSLQGLIFGTELVEQ